MKLEESLIGKTVIFIDVGDYIETANDYENKDKALRFRCDDGTAVVWSTSGDCCSESWWADLLNIGQLRNHTVVDVLELTLPEPRGDGRSRQDSDSAYGYAIKTDRGVCTAIFRNSSNGYYGGDAYLSDGKGLEWREITEYEWSA